MRCRRSTSTSTFPASGRSSGTCPRDRSVRRAASPARPIYKPVDGRFYEANTDAVGPGGAFKLRELIAYHKEQKALARQATDSRGFTYLQIGTIGGDLGGYYNIYFESSPFTYGGKTLRIKHALRLLSPLNYKVATTLSVDGGPYRNYGNPWWRKDAAATSR